MHTTNGTLLCGEVSRTKIKLSLVAAPFQGLVPFLMEISFRNADFPSTLFLERLLLLLRNNQLKIILRPKGQMGWHTLLPFSVLGGHNVGLWPQPLINVLVSSRRRARP